MPVPAAEPAQLLPAVLQGGMVHHVSRAWHVVEAWFRMNSDG